MYKCTDCNEIFEDPMMETNEHPYGDSSAYETYNVCPYCEGDYEDATECSDCGELFLSIELENNKCKSCLKIVCEDMIKDISNDLKKICDGYDKEDINMLYEYIQTLDRQPLDFFNLI